MVCKYAEETNRQPRGLSPPGCDGCLFDHSRLVRHVRSRQPLERYATQFRILQVIVLGIYCKSLQEGVVHASLELIASANKCIVLVQALLPLVLQIERSNRLPHFICSVQHNGKLFLERIVRYVGVHVAVAG